MNNDRIQRILLTVSVALFAGALFFAKDIPADFAVLRTRHVHFDDSTTLVRLALINSAVKPVAAQKYFEYTGGFENPFKPLKTVHPTPQNGSSTAAAKTQRSKLLLKGILTKNKPLAIIEDATGETYIRGVGDKVLDQTITTITNNSVTLRDHQSTYVLVVEEQ